MNIEHNAAKITRNEVHITAHEKGRLTTLAALEGLTLKPFLEAQFRLMAEKGVSYGQLWERYERVAQELEMLSNQL